MEFFKEYFEVGWKTSVSQIFISQFTFTQKVNMIHPSSYYYFMK